MNVYGHDPVRCGPVGGEVTEDNYRAYLARRNECGQQGVGPMQLTHRSLQQRADDRGGCWVPRVNVQVGLELFEGHLAKGGSPAVAFSLFNTGKPGPSPYAARAMLLLPGWQKVIDG